LERIDEMLRWTKRLRYYLASKGQATYGWQVNDCARPLLFLAEAELTGAVESNRSIETSPPADTSIKHPVFTIDTLRKLMIGSITWDRVLFAHPLQCSDDGAKFIQNVKEEETFDSNTVEILWLSPTEFVSRQLIRKMQQQYALKVYFGGTPVRSATRSLELMVYSIAESDAAGPTPAGGESVLSQLLLPAIGRISRMVLDFSEPATSPPIESVLSLIPTASQAIEHRIDVAFIDPCTDLLQSLTSFPFHPNVLLRLIDGGQQTTLTTVQELNNSLRECQHLRQVEVPNRFQGFDSTIAPFTCNPALTSVTIAASVHNKLPSILFDSICNNESIKELNIELKNKYDDFGYDWSDRLRSQFGGAHGLSSIRFLNTYGSRKLPIEATYEWSTHVVPSLLLNWLRQQGQSHPPLKLLKVEIQAVNTGVVLDKTTNLKSDYEYWNRASSATAIFFILRRSVKNDRGAFRGTRGKRNAWYGRIRARRNRSKA
jgi:hypothetical protein